MEQGRWMEQTLMDGAVATVDLTAAAGGKVRAFLGSWTGAQRRGRGCGRTTWGQRGFTLLEVIFMIAILMSLMAILVRNLTSTTENAKKDQAVIAMGTISQALQLYRLHNNKYPATAQGLDALMSDPGEGKRWRGPYIEKEKLVDPWGTTYDYSSDGRKFEIISAGPDLTFGTDQDVFYPERESTPEAG